MFYCAFYLYFADCGVDNLYRALHRERTEGLRPNISTYRLTHILIRISRGLNGGLGLNTLALRLSKYSSRILGHSLIPIINPSLQ